MIYVLGAVKYDDTFMVQMRPLDEDGNITGGANEEREIEVSGTLCVSESGQLCLYANDIEHRRGTKSSKSDAKDKD